MRFKSFITGIAGTSLSDGERRFLSAERPWGLILFKRNCETADQIRFLVREYRAIVGNDRAPVFIDQEGGRVQRLKPPICPIYPPGEIYGRVYLSDQAKGARAAYLGARLIADDLISLGINGDCLPVLDIPWPGSHDVIGDRAYGDNVDIVTALGRAAANGLLDGGVLPVIKHIPGHGRAGADSHLSLPRVDASLEDLTARDFEPFRRLNDLPLAMTAHVVFDNIDGDAPVTVSQKAIDGIIRQKIGYDGCLMSDDVSMQALSGTIRERTEALFAAGCDLALHCNGDLSEMEAVAAMSPWLSGEAARRANAATAMLGPAKPFDRASAEAEFKALLDGAEPIV